MSDKVKIKVNGTSLIEGIVRVTGETVEVEAETAEALSSGGGVTIVTETAKPEAKTAES